MQPRDLQAAAGTGFRILFGVAEVLPDAECGVWEPGGLQLECGHFGQPFLAGKPGGQCDPEFGSLLRSGGLADGSGAVAAQRRQIGGDGFECQCQLQ